MNFFEKISNSISIFANRGKYVNHATYYPQEELKSKSEILKDHLFYIWKFGKLEPFYFTYGFDRKRITREVMLKEYITPYGLFEKRINYLNFHNPRYDDFHGKLTCRVITGDKFYFNIFLERFGIPTPRIFCFIKDKRPLYIDPDFSGGLPYDHLDGKMALLDFLSHDMDAFAKPSDGQLGNGAFSLKVDDGVIYVNGNATPIDEVISALLSSDYLIQECVKQHPDMSSLCPSCINSIRLQTVMDKNGEVHPFGAGIRIGRVGSFVDNWAKGGIFVGINDDGTMKDVGFIKPKYGTSVKEHPDTHVKFSGFKVPFFKEAVELAVKLHGYMYRAHSVGWDIAITEDGPVFIEGNGWWEISLVQAVHGGLKKKIEPFFYQK